MPGLLDPLTYRSWGDGVVAGLAGSSATLDGMAPLTSARAANSWPEPWTPSSSPVTGASMPDATLPAMPETAAQRAAREAKEKATREEEAAEYQWVRYLLWLAIGLILLGVAAFLFGRPSAGDAVAAVQEVL